MGARGARRQSRDDHGVHQRLQRRRLAQLVDRSGGAERQPDRGAVGRDWGHRCARERIVKPPRAWKNTPAEELVALDGLRERTVFFTGTAQQAAASYPQNANATVVTSLAGIGLDRTRVELIADPASTMNGHRIIASGAFGRMDITLENKPLATNPKSSELTALSLVRLIEHRAKRIIV